MSLELTNALIKEGFVSEDHRQKLENYLHARDEFNGLFGGNDGVHKIIKELYQNQDALRGRVTGLMETTKNCGLALGESLSSVRKIEDVTASCLDVLDKSLQSGLKQKAKAIYKLADELDCIDSRVYGQAKEIDRHIHERVEMLTNLEKSLRDFEKEMLNIKKSLTDNEVDKKIKNGVST